MPYKDPEKQKQAQKEYYERNKEKSRASSRAYKARILEKLNKVKADRGPCVDCNQSFHPYAMDFDHVKGEKIGNVSYLIKTSPWSKVQEEIDKCELVCAICHRIRTWNRLPKNLKTTE